MRWLFLDPESRADVARRERYLRLIDRWWQEFADESQALIESLDRPEAQLFAERLQERLGRIDRRLCWEIGPGANGKPHRLVVTPETDMALRPLTATLLERAPELPNWEFYSHRLAERAEMLPYTLEHRVGKAPRDLRAFVEPAGARKLSLRFASPDFSDADDEPMEMDCASAFVAAEALLGEEFVDQWIAFVGVERAETNERGAFELIFGRRPPCESLAPEELREACWKAAEALRDQSPDAPYFRRTEPLAWTSDERLAVESADSVAARRATGDDERGVLAPPVDVLWSRTIDRDLREAFEEPLFFSASWSRSGETFCRMKLSPSEIRPTLELERIVREVDGALRSASLGCVVGMSSGNRFGYVDLALVDLPVATEKLRAFGRRAAAGGCIGRESWLLFHDAYLSGEWIGLAEDSPAPEGMG